MARRRLLTGEERRRLVDAPHDETMIVGHYTLASEDLDLMYDPMLNCYYDPKTNKYYELG